jgi:hypothetical protein
MTLPLSAGQRGKQFRTGNLRGCDRPALGHERDNQGRADLVDEALDQRASFQIDHRRSSTTV